MAASYGPDWFNADLERYAACLSVRAISHCLCPLKGKEVAARYALYAFYYPMRELLVARDSALVV